MIGANKMEYLAELQTLSTETLTLWFNTLIITIPLKTELFCQLFSALRLVDKLDLFYLDNVALFAGLDYRIFAPDMVLAVRPNLSSSLLFRPELQQVSPMELSQTAKKYGWGCKLKELQADDWSLLRLARRVQSTDPGIFACLNDDADKVRVLLADPGRHDTSSWLTAAASMGAIKCFKFLLINRAAFGDQIIKAAIAGGNEEIIQLLLENNIAITPDCASCAAVHGRTRVLEWVCEQTGCPITDEICASAVRSGNFATLVWCVENAPQDCLFCMLVWAIKMRQTDAVDFLLANGARIDDRTLKEAMTWGNLDVVNLLLERRCAVTKSSFEFCFDLDCILAAAPHLEPTSATEYRVLLEMAIRSFAMGMDDVGKAYVYIHAELANGNRITALPDNDRLESILCRTIRPPSLFHDVMCAMYIPGSMDSLIPFGFKRKTYDHHIDKIQRQNFSFS